MINIALVKNMVSEIYSSHCVVHLQKKSFHLTTLKFTTSRHYFGILEI